MTLYIVQHLRVMLKPQAPNPASAAAARTSIDCLPSSNDSYCADFWLFLQHRLASAYNLMKQYEHTSLRHDNATPSHDSGTYINNNCGNLMMGRPAPTFCAEDTRCLYSTPPTNPRLNTTCFGDKMQGTAILKQNNAAEFTLRLTPIDAAVYESGVTATGPASVRKLREQQSKCAQVRAHHGRDGVLVFLVQLREQYLTKRRGAALLLCAYY